MKALFPLFFALGLTALGQAEKSPPPPEKPNVEDLGEGKFRIGLVTFDQTTRRIQFPAVINMQEGKLEFVIVHEQGKIHEALLATKIDAFHLNVALKLLRYQDSPELFEILKDGYKPTGKYPEVASAVKKAARLDFSVSWKDAEGTAHEKPINELIFHTPSDGPLPAQPWVYGGSYIHNGVFQAKAQGELAALFTSRISLLNYPGPDHVLDDVWEPNTKTVPAAGTPVTVTLAPHSPSK